MTVHQTNDHPAAPQGNQCLFSHFLASLGAKEIAHNCTSMLWSIDSCENRVSADQYHMAVPRAQVSTHWGRVFFEVFCWQNTSFKWSHFFIFSHDSYEISCVYVIMAPRYEDFHFKLTSDAKIQPVFTNTSREDLSLPWSSIGHALCPIFMLWLVKIWHASSCGQFMLHLESCLPWQLK